MSDELHPAAGRLAVVDPPVEEGAIWLPPSAAGLAGDLEFAVVAEVGRDVEEYEPGDVVYFHHGHFAMIGDTKIIAADCVLAYRRRTS